MNKLLVIAGTHSRENEYSHGVAEKLLKHYGRQSAPDSLVESLDGARVGELYQLDDLSLGIIKSTGKLPSQEYLQSLSIEQLAGIATIYFAHRNNPTPAHISESNGFGQWTTVTTPLFDASGADILLDLHSYHNQTRGVVGKCMQITVDAKKSISNYFKSALIDAQTNEPSVYGMTFKPSSEKEIMRKIAFSLFDKQELIDILNTPYDKLKLDDSNIKELFDTYNSGVDFESRLNWQHFHKSRGGWNVREQSDILKEVQNYAYLEAVHWSESQQEATRKFITDYLLPKLSD